MLLIGGCVAVLGLGCIALMLSQPPARDGVTGCLRAATGLHVAVIVDRTDPWKPAARALLRQALSKFAESVPTEGRLTMVSFMGGADAVPKVTFDRCRPAEGKDVNPTFSTREKVDRDYADAYGTPLSAQIDDLTGEVASASSTHLVEFVATNAAALTYSSNASRKVLRVYSDMNEHTVSGSFIGRQPFTVAGFTSYARERLEDRLKGIELQIVVTRSPSSPPAVARRIKEAWAAALLSLGVSFTWEQL